MIDPKEITIKDKKFIISKLPTLTARKLMFQFPVSAIPKLGDYQVNEEMALILYAHCAVLYDDGKTIILNNAALINNHIKCDCILGLKLEAEMMRYNFDFFGHGLNLDFLESLTQDLPELITKILTDSLERLSLKVRPLSMN